MGGVHLAFTDQRGQVGVGSRYRLDVEWMRRSAKRLSAVDTRCRCVDASIEQTAYQSGSALFMGSANSRPQTRHRTMRYWADTRRMTDPDCSQTGHDGPPPDRSAAGGVRVLGGMIVAGGAAAAW